MWSIDITEEEMGNTPEEVALTLRYIAEQIEQGYCSGVCPNWSISKGANNE